MPKHFYRDAVIYAVPLYFMENHALTGTDMPFLSYGRITVRTYTTPVSKSLQPAAPRSVHCLLPAALHQTATL